ncbi:MAG: sensor histidine kinase [Campylobacterales bacterium]|nr:sensor histidine kinase [Campylobacterales bacterium]
MKRILQLSIFIGIIVTFALAGVTEYRIGVLAKRGATKAVEQWTPTAEYLTKSLSTPFVIVPLDFDEVDDAVSHRRVDFIIANSAYYVDMEYKYGLSPVATLQNRSIGGKSYKVFGGVIFTKQERDDIKTLEDLKGKRFAAVDPNSFGGWHVSWHVMQHNGINPEKDFSLLMFSGTHDNVVMDILSGKADAGCVRTDTLERMALEGKISLKLFKIIHPLKGEGFDFVRSTPLYPEWPIAKLPHVPDITAKRVAIALMSMEPEAPAAVASQIKGWCIPSNYQKVHEVLKDLKIDPYRFLREIPLSEVILQYRYYLFVIFVTMIFFIVVIFMIIVLNRRLKSTMTKLEEEVSLKEQATKELEIRSNNLAKANEQLKELDKLKSMFVASMSHELRTPLNSIIGFTGVLLQGISGPLNEKQQDQLSRVKSAGQHLLSLISDVIDISKIEAGRAEARVEEFSLRELIEEAKNEIEIVAAPKGLSIEIEMDEEVQMHSDKRRIYQCLLNYLSNAVKFTEKSGTIIVKVKESGNDVKISVTDQGIGIAKEEQSKLFEAFERLETHLRVIPGGTGLGLYLTRKITETLLQGSVWMESKEGEGSLFGLLIPKYISAQEEG